MNIHNLFPTALGMFNLGRDLTEVEISFIKNQEKRNNMGNTTSVDTTILKNPELKSVKDFIEQSIAQYFKEVYAPKNDTALRITQSWCNYTEPGQFHHKHAHPNSFISGVFYPQANKETDKIYFYRDGYQQLKTPTEDFNQYNSDSWWMEAYTGRMFLFPSNLTHMVETVEGKDTRISLSFNTFPVGNIGQDESLTGLHL
jgi:uncharacterized protein (TIGR02466 family)